VAIAVGTHSTLRPDLATFESLDLELNRRGLVIARMMTPFEVPAAQGPFKKIKLASLLAALDADVSRGPKGDYNESEYDFEEDSYKTIERGWEEPLDDAEKNMYRNFLDMEMVAAGRAWEVLMTRLEARGLAVAIDATVTASRSAAAAAVWTNYSSATPLDDVKTARKAVWSRTGRRPNVIAMAYDTFDDCRRCAQVTNAIASQGAGSSVKPGDINAAMLAQCFDVVVADSVKNTANRAKDAVVASLFPEDKVWLGVRSNSNDYRDPCFGRILHWGGDGSQINESESLIGVVETYRWEKTRGDRLRVRHQTQEKALYPEMAQVITGIRS
jgi:hypothetical protein